MGAVRMRVQTADKNITIIHTNSSPSVCEAKSFTRQQEMDFFTRGIVIMDYGLNDGFNDGRFKNVLMDLFQLLASQDVN